MTIFKPILGSSFIINKYKINNDDITGINTAGFIKELKQNGIYDQYLSNKKNENNLRSLFTQSVIKERDVLVYNQLDGTVTEQKAGYVDGVQYVGKNDYNSPILDTLGIPLERHPFSVTLPRF